jgi:hypothetical protein
MLALSLTMQMVAKGCTATVVRFVLPTNDDHDEDDLIKHPVTRDGPSANPSFYRTASGMPELSVFPEHVGYDTSLFESLKLRLGEEGSQRVTFDTFNLTMADTSGLVTSVVNEVTRDLDTLPKKMNSLVVVGRNYGLKGLSRGPRHEVSEVEHSLGLIGVEFSKSGISNASFVIVKATSSA